MSTCKRYWIINFLLLAGLLLAACGGPATEEPVVKEPSEVAIAAVFGEGLENDWDLMFYNSIKRVQADLPHGLKSNELVYTEGFYGADMVRVMKEYAATDNYDIVMTNAGGYVEQFDELLTLYPNDMFLNAGYPIGRKGGNLFDVVKYVHEATYLMGVLAGKLTKTNIIGAVAPYPYEDVSSELNGFFEGARAVNPDVKIRVTFIQSWYDPPKAIEGARAQIAAGVDQMFMRSEGWEMCEEYKITCYGVYVDNTALAPNTNLANAFGYWDPEIRWAIEQWWNHVTTGEPYNATTELVWFGMKDGGSALGPLNPAIPVPQEVVDLLKQIEKEILDGSLVLQPNIEPPKSD